MEKLPLPQEIKTIQGVDVNATTEQRPADGRQRSFPHERGQWTAHVYIKLENEELDELLQSISEKNFDGVHLLDQLHVTVVRGHHTLRHHHIDAFWQQIEKKLESFSPFTICFDKLELFDNEENTRSFVTLTECDATRSVSRRLGDALQDILNDFVGVTNQNRFSTNTFHCSIAWSLPEFKDNLRKLVEILESSLEEPLMINVFKVETKIGNLTKRIALNKNLVCLQ